MRAAGRAWYMVSKTMPDFWAMDTATLRLRTEEDVRRFVEWLTSLQDPQAVHPTGHDQAGLLSSLVRLCALCIRRMHTTRHLVLDIKAPNVVYACPILDIVPRLYPRLVALVIITPMLYGESFIPHLPHLRHLRIASNGAPGTCHLGWVPPPLPLPPAAAVPRWKLTPDACCAGGCRS